MVSVPLASRVPCRVLVPVPAKVTLLNGWPAGSIFWLAPLKVTVPALGVKVPWLFQVPDTLRLALGALTVVPLLMVRLPNWVPSIEVPPMVSVPLVPSVTVLAALIVKLPPLAVQLLPFMVKLLVPASRVPLFRVRSPLTVIALPKLTDPETVTVRLAKAVLDEGNSSPVAPPD